MDIQEYISSGILELFVAGKLSEEENLEVFRMMEKHEEVLLEVQRIEATVVQLTEALVPVHAKHSFQNIQARLVDDQSKNLTVSKSGNFRRNLGWAAALVLGGALTWVIVQNRELSHEIELVQSQKEVLENELATKDETISQQEDVLSLIRSKEVQTIRLEGQTISPESYAKVFWDKNTNQVHLDLKGLPDPPEGKVYQVWSLKLNPLTPTSLGVVNDFVADQDKIFTLDNSNASEAFGITLEPEGGSPTPTLEQLYTLGKV